MVKPFAVIAAISSSVNTAFVLAANVTVQAEYPADALSNEKMCNE